MSPHPESDASKRPDALPLSFAQRRLWFLDRLEGPNHTYNIPFAVRLSGELDRDALHAAIADVVTRHEILRTVFPEADGQPWQRVLDADDALARPAVANARVSEAELHDALARAARHEFDLAARPPLRLTLFTLSSREHVLLLVMHHIASDGWSTVPLLHDLTRAYESRCQGHAPDWDALPIQYADYALEQDRMLGGQQSAAPDARIVRQLDYWTATLADLPTRLPLPAARPRSREFDFRGAQAVFRIPPQVHGDLLRLTRESRTTLFMVLQAGLSALLTRVGAGTDIPIGTAVAGRADEELDDLVGFFVNTLVLRVDTSGEPAFRELLDRVRSVDLDALAHQDLPFERLVEALNPERVLGVNPLFQVMLVMQDHPDEVVRVPGLEVRLIDDIPSDVAKFDLSFTFRERRGADGAAEGIDCSVEYRADLFEQGAVEAMADRLLRLFEAVAADPDRPIGQIEILSGDERRCLLLDWNGAERPAPAVTVSELFEAQAARSPDAIAVAAGDTTLTYAQLNARANRLARRLVKLGVRAETPVALLMERSADLLVALLAVMKAGGVYVPLHAAYPQPRMQWVLEDVGAPVLLVDRTTQSHGLVRDADPDLGIVVVDDAQTDAESDGGSDDNLGIACAADQLMYIMHTSGSTGRPKGVAITHRNVVSLALDQCWAGGNQERVLFHAPHAFDASTYELWVPLLQGGRVVVAPAGDVDAPLLRSLIARERITAVHVTAGLFRVIAEEDPECFAGVREVLTGGDVVSPAAVRSVLDAVPGVVVRHLYGPTEITLAATQYPVNSPDQVLPHTLPIGRPMDNTRIHVLDSALRLVPEGVVGELYIAGEGLARGYVNRPGLTADRFVADPFGPPGSRMYQTGDLARWNTAGELEFAGRADDQVKVRGFRVEPGEVEAVVARHPRVAQAAVAVREDRAGDKRLIAYVVQVPGSTALDAADVQAFIGASLPEYMIPSAAVVLDALPLTSNGKLDRQALPAPAARVSGSARGPRTAREEILRGLFAQVLEVPEVGIDDGFFELGGHSLSAARLMARVRATFGVELPLRVMFESPTVEGLARRIEHGLSELTFGALLTLRAGGERTPLFCVHPALGFGWSYAALLPYLPDRVPVYALQTTKIDASDARYGDMTAIAAHYIDRVRTVQPTGPYRLLGWSFGGLVAFEMAAQLERAGERVELLAVLDALPESRKLDGPSEDDEPADQAALRILHAGGGAPADLTDVDLVDMAEVLENNHRVMSTYRPGRIQSELLLFSAAEEGMPADMKARLWAAHASAVRVHDVASGHYGMMADAPAQQIAKILDAALDES